MAKHGIEGDPDDYCLVQLIPGGGIYVSFLFFFNVSICVFLYVFKHVLLEYKFCLSLR